jgi:hypothetical protein
MITNKDRENYSITEASSNDTKSDNNKEKYNSKISESIDKLKQKKREVEQLAVNPEY